MNEDDDDHQVTRHSQDWNSWPGMWEWLNYANKEMQHGGGYAWLDNSWHPFKHMRPWDKFIDRQFLFYRN